MKIIIKSVIISIALMLMLIADVPILFEQLVPDAYGIYGVRRRTRRRTAVVVGTSATAAATATKAAAQQQTAAAQQEEAAAKKEGQVCQDDRGALFKTIPF